jgi:putative redox protein
MIASAIWRHDMTFEAHSESGHTVVFDSDASHAGGPTPMEAVLMALCGCTSVDVVAILKKKREPFTGLTVSAVAEQASEAPRVFTKIELIYRVTGNVSRKSMEDAVALSKNKYCSVSKMLEKAAEIKFRIEYDGEQVEIESPAVASAKGGSTQE